jgi:transposase
MPDGPNLSPEDQQEAERRYGVLEPLVKPNLYPALWAKYGPSKTAVVNFLAAQRKTSARTILRWLRQWDEGGLPALAPKDRSDKSKPRKPNAAALDFILAAALPKQGSYGELSARDIFRAYREERAWRASNAAKVLNDFESGKYSRYTDGNGKLSAAAQLPVLSYDTVRRCFYRTPEVVRVLARSGQEAFSNTQEILSFRDLSALAPLDYLVMDHRMLDLWAMVLRDGKWVLIRPWLTASIDMRTRKWIAHTLCEVPSSSSISYVLKKGIILYGVPKAVYWDCGRDFRAAVFEGKQTKTRESGAITELNDGWRGILQTLGIRVHHAIVRRARSKIIEPAFRATALFDRSLPYWCGHRPSTRPERFQALLDQHAKWVIGEAESPAFPTIEQLAADYDDLLAELNERPREHAQGMRKVTASGHGWMSPEECWERLIGQVDRRDAPAEVLQFCFHKRREITVQHGEIRTCFGGKTFHYRLNDSAVRLMIFNGLKVDFAYDPMDLETVAIYHLDRFVGLATCVELRRMGEDTFAQDERARRASRREVKRFIAEVHQQVHVPDHRERANRRRAVLPVRTEPKRPVVAAAIPKAIIDAAASAAEESKFSFAAPSATLDTESIPVSKSMDGAAVIRQANANAYLDDDCTFKFFDEEGS